MLLPVGVSVKLSFEWIKRNRDSLQNPQNTRGEIIEQISDIGYRIRWDNGSVASYYDAQVELLTKGTPIVYNNKKKFVTDLLARFEAGEFLSVCVENKPFIDFLHRAKAISLKRNGHAHVRNMVLMSYLCDRWSRTTVMYN